MRAGHALLLDSISTQPRIEQQHTSQTMGFWCLFPTVWSEARRCYYRSWPSGGKGWVSGFCQLTLQFTRCRK